MFDNIAPAYDRLNHTLSLSVDRIWRRRVVRIVGRLHPRRVLDMATGTGDLAIAMARRIEGVQVMGVDLSEAMLAVARRKVEARGLDNRIVLDRGDAEHLAAEREHRALEAQARARGRLEKQCCEDLPVALVGILLGVLHDRAGGVDELHDLLRGQLHNVDQMLHITPDFLPGSSSRRRGFRGRPAAARRRPR